MQGKAIIVTGAFGALGKVVSGAFAERGARVAMVDKAPPPAAAAALGGETLVLGGVDLTKADEAKTVVEQVLARFGRLDVLVNVAGGFRWETVAEGDPATWDLLYGLNVATAANMSRAAIPALVDAGGRIVNVGAGGAVKAAAGMGAYAASKAGVHRLTEALAEELKGKVNVNAVLPSIIDTPQNRADMPKADFGAWVSPADLAAVILFLASDEARAVTGALLPVNGRV